MIRTYLLLQLHFRIPNWYSKYSKYFPQIFLIPEISFHIIQAGKKGLEKDVFTSIHDLFTLQNYQKIKKSFSERFFFLGSSMYISFSHYSLICFYFQTLRDFRKTHFSKESDTNPQAAYGNEMQTHRTCTLGFPTWKTFFQLQDYSVT